MADDRLKDILRRVEKLKRERGLSNQQIEEHAKLTSGWLSQLKSGRYGPGAGSRKRFERWLSRFEAGLPDEGEPAAAPSAPVAPAPTAPTAVQLELEAEIKRAKTQRRLGALLTRIMADLAAARMDPEVFELLREAIVKRSKIVKEEKAEKAEQAVRRLEILTPSEIELVRQYRALVAGSPLKPGESVPPPDAAPPRPHLEPVTPEELDLLRERRARGAATVAVAG